MIPTNLVFLNAFVLTVIVWVVVEIMTCHNVVPESIILGFFLIFFINSLIFLLLIIAFVLLPLLSLLLFILLGLFNITFIITLVLLFAAFVFRFLCIIFFIYIAFRLMLLLPLLELLLSFSFFMLDQFINFTILNSLHTILFLFFSGCQLRNRTVHQFARI